MVTQIEQPFKQKHITQINKAVYLTDIFISVRSTRAYFTIWVFITQIKHIYGGDQISCSLAGNTILNMEIKKAVVVGPDFD